MQPIYRAEQSPFQQVVNGIVLRFTNIFWKIPAPLGVWVTSKILMLLSQKVDAKIGIEPLANHLILEALYGRLIVGSSLISWE